MPQHDKHDKRTETARSSLIILLFGLALLAFLVAIDRPQWFHIRPATGTAAAMGAVSDLAASAKGS